MVCNQSSNEKKKGIPTQSRGSDPCLLSDGLELDLRGCYLQALARTYFIGVLDIVLSCDSLKVQSMTKDILADGPQGVAGSH